MDVWHVSGMDTQGLAALGDGCSGSMDLVRHGPRFGMLRGMDALGNGSSGCLDGCSAQCMFLIYRGF